MAAPATGQTLGPTTLKAPIWPGAARQPAKAPELFARWTGVVVPSAYQCHQLTA